MSVTIAVVNSRAEAELVAGMLRNHGIIARVSADDLGGVDLARKKPPNAFQRWLFSVLGGNK